MFMMQIDEHGRPVAFYNTDINEDIPTDAIEISDNAWQYCIDNNGSVRWNGSSIELIPAEPLPPVVAQSVTDRQFIQALAEDQYKIITWDEAEAWGARGDLPLMLTTALDKIEDAVTKQRARYFLKTAKSFDRNHWATAMIGQLLGWSSEDLDHLWNFADTL